jgi:periplasmic divalent cation tolerance protein
MNPSFFLGVTHPPAIGCGAQAPVRAGPSNAKQTDQNSARPGTMRLPLGVASNPWQTPCSDLVWHGATLAHDQRCNDLHHLRQRGDGFAACVNIFPAIKSYYYYKGGTHLDEEVMLMIKTTREHFETVSQVITELHTYEIPEILMVPVEACSEGYLEWMEHSVSRQA